MANGADVQNFVVGTRAASSDTKVEAQRNAGRALVAFLANELGLTADEIRSVLFEAVQVGNHYLRDEIRV